MSLRTLEQMVGRYSRLAGLKRKATPHDGRRSFGRELNRSGTDLRTVQTLLDHEQLATTQIYTYVDDEERREAVKRQGDRRRQRERELLGKEGEGG